MDKLAFYARVLTKIAKVYRGPVSELPAAGTLDRDAIDQALNFLNKVVAYGFNPRGASGPYIQKRLKSYKSNPKVFSGEYPFHPREKSDLISVGYGRKVDPTTGEETDEMEDPFHVWTKYDKRLKELYLKSTKSVNPDVVKEFPKIIDLIYPYDREAFKKTNEIIDPTTGRPYSEEPIQYADTTSFTDSAPLNMNFFVNDPRFRGSHLQVTPSDHFDPYIVLKTLLAGEGTEDGYYTMEMNRNQPYTGKGAVLDPNTLLRELLQRAQVSKRLQQKKLTPLEAITKFPLALSGIGETLPKGFGDKLSLLTRLLESGHKIKDRDIERFI